MAQPNPVVENTYTPQIGEGLDTGIRVPDEALQQAAFPFAEQLKGALETHIQHAQLAEQKATDFAEGRLDDIHGTMIAMKEEGIELRLIANVRSKILDAFNDLWRINV
jgi:flagellar hook-basal body complex protein FliE